ncbi:MAG TPA: ABC transporter ATP-binding protein [Thermoanaerobaculaceae bacterium]|nr:ABC transporter ATP-binding protein [Thermoanaerobaculaceae bacterium]
MSGAREAVFTVEDVRFAYPGGEPCLDGLSFDVLRGERLALVGANGSGKSTLLHILDALFVPSGGRVAYLGTALSEEALASPAFGPRFRQEVGFLFQNSDAQLFCPTVEEELAFGPLQAGWAQGEVLRRIEDTLALLEISRLRSRAPAGLSAGEKKRVALASLLVLSPSVLLLDEPTAGLDPRSQSLLLEILEALHARGLTLVTATHDLTLLPHLADRVVVLSEEHRVVADGEPQRVLADTELLLAVNLIHAHSHRHGRLVHTHPHQHVVAHDHGHDHHHEHGE